MQFNTARLSFHCFPPGTDDSCLFVSGPPVTSQAFSFFVRFDQNLFDAASFVDSLNNKYAVYL